MKVSIQINFDKCYWDDVKATKHDLRDPVEFAKNLALATGKEVRMTYPPDGEFDDFQELVGRCSGHYFSPTVGDQI